VDTATLSFSVSDTTNFKIDGDKLKTKISINTVGDMNINITADDGTNTPATQAFTIAVITDIPDITPVIKQFTVTQGNNQGRVISKTGGVVTVHATVIAKTYEWSSVDVTDTSASGDTVFVFDPANTDAGILTITLKATTNAHSSERVLKLELITESVSNSDDDGDGIPNNKDNNTAINKIQAGAGKTITSPTNTRILLGAMGEDSSRLTLAQMQQYITDNNLPNKSSDTSTNPAFQALSSAQVVLVLEWIALLVSTSKSAQPVTNEYLRNSAFAGIAVVSSIITSVVAPVALKPSTT
jgi:hypothetical protein